jgi:MFS transporter, MHS family, proline/betaine transporter
MNKRKLILTSGVANTFEWYDYALFGHFAPIIGQKFFPESDPGASLLQAFLVFAIGYLMRPIGGVFFGVIGDKFGRRVALSSAVICMAIPTAAIGFLPSYETMGIISTSLMIVVRMLQGLSMGGALTGSISFVIEHTTKKHRGIAGSISMSSICIGILLGSTAAYLTRAAFSPEQFNEWGWRLPFIFGIFIFFAGLYIKNHTDETPLFKDAQNRGEIAHSPLREVFSKHWRDIIISILINATGSIIFYFEAIYLMTYLRINRGFDEGDVVSLINFCYVIMAVVTVLVGWLSDKINRRKIFVFNLVIIICAGPVIMTVLQEGDFLAVSLAQVTLAIIAASYIGPEPALQAEFYPTNIRNTALSVAYNAATSIFGGTAPYIIESLVQNTGSLTSSTYYIITSAVLSLGALYFYQDRSAVDHQVEIEDESSWEA